MFNRHPSLFKAWHLRKYSTPNTNHSRICLLKLFSSHLRFYLWAYTGAEILWCYTFKNWLLCNSYCSQVISKHVLLLRSNTVKPVKLHKRNNLLYASNSIKSELKQFVNNTIKVNAGHNEEKHSLQHVSITKKYPRCLCHSWMEFVNNRIKLNPEYPTKGDNYCHCFPLQKNTSNAHIEKVQWVLVN